MSSSGLPTPPREMRPEERSSKFTEKPKIVQAHEEDAPTDSHELAGADVEEKGVAQTEHDDVEVKNLGWNEKKEGVPEPLVGHLSNDELWAMIRRFNKQIFHVKSIDETPLAALDLNIADEEEFSPDKLRAHLERFYMTVVVGLFSFWKHIVRIRSWREWQRTSVFLATYTVAWLLDLLLPTLFGFLVVLVVYPKSRQFCFPHAPPSLINRKTGGVQTPAAGLLGSDDSVTGAVENHKGEAVEQEAHSFVNSFSSIAVGTAVGKNPHSDPHDYDGAPDPTSISETAAEATKGSQGVAASKKHDKTKQPVSEMAWGQARPVMHALADVADTWERFGNALSPTPPFPRMTGRLRIAAILVPLALGTSFLTAYMMIKGVGFTVGFTLFGDPIIQPTMTFINRTYPRWQKYVELRHTVLRGVPTNAQLTITLLRMGERNKAPIPPPPTSNTPPPMEAHATAGENLEHLDVTGEEMADAVHPDEQTLQDEAESEEDVDGSKTKKKKPNKLVAFLKGTTKGGVRTAMGVDHAKAAVGARHARDRLGAVKKEGSTPETGPVRFPARYKGKKGHAYITVTSTTPAVSWTTDLSEPQDPAWTVTVGDIGEIRKVGGFGWKSKIIVNWATNKEIADGLIVADKQGREFHLTSILERDELFNRLVAMGSQMWEAW